MTVMPVAPDLIVWAREHRGLELHEAAELLWHYRALSFSSRAKRKAAPSYDRFGKSQLRFDPNNMLRDTTTESSP